MRLPLPPICLAVMALALHGAAQEPEKPALPSPRMRDAEKVHDPSPIVVANGVRRIFSTGMGVSLMREDPSGKWLRDGQIFRDGTFPAWHEEKVPGNRGYLWAPDVIRVEDKWFVYYSVSTFGRNTSAIGLVVGGSLDPASPQWQWEDRGPVLTSSRGDRFNAIDPAIFRDDDEGPLWMAFGSFWDGIHLVELDPSTGMRKTTGAPLLLAAAPEIEAPFLCKHGDHYFLFVNWGLCCRGVNSTYEIRAGRSRSVTGPYLDRNGADLRHGGGTLVLGSEDRWIGPGHASLFQHDGKEWLVHHYYDREFNGRSRLRMVPLTWDPDGWPVVLSASITHEHQSADPANPSGNGKPGKETTDR